jgi:hypothetical protein
VDGGDSRDLASAFPDYNPAADGEFADARIHEQHSSIGNCGDAVRGGTSRSAGCECGGLSARAGTGVSRGG